MFLPTVLRPLPGRHPATGMLGVPITAVVAPGGFLSEDLSRELTERDTWSDTVWLRLRYDGVDKLAEAVAAARHRHILARDGSPAKVLVLELTGRIGTEATRYLQRLADHSTSLVVVSDHNLPDVLRPIALPARNDEVDALGGGRLSGWGAKHPVLVRDTLDAGQAWGDEIVNEVVAKARRPRALPFELTTALLNRADRSHCEMLDLAVRAGYWHPDLGAEPGAGAPCRPWLIPLEDGWWWMRPQWRTVLDRCLRQRSQRPEPPKPAATVARPTVFEAHLLGSFEVAIDGRAIVDWQGRLGINVVRYLLVQEGRSCHRDQLIEEFWPEADPVVARNRLQVAVSAARKALRSVTDTTVIDYSHGRYRISPDLDVVSDVDQFRAGLAAAAAAERAGDIARAISSYTEAVRWYRGDLAPDVPYDSWALLPRERLRIELIDVLDRLCTLQLGRGGIDEAIAIAHRIVERDPCREDMHRILMQCYADQGRSHQAVRQYEFCVRALKANLEMPPSAETVRLYREIVVR